MIEQLEKIERTDALIVVAGENKGNCTCEFKYNIYDLNSMRVIMYNISGDFRDLPEQAELSLVFEYGNVRNVLTVEVENGMMALATSMSELQTGVSKFYRQQILKRETEPVSISVFYNFPLISLTNNTRRTTRHSSFGFFRGICDWDTGIAKFEKDSFKVGGEDKVFEISSNYRFHNSESLGLYQLMYTIEHSSCSTKRGLDSSTYQEVLREVDREAEYLFRLVSLLEHNRINWTNQLIYVLDNHNDIVEKIEIYRWSPPPSNYDRVRDMNCSNMRQTLNQLYTAYLQQGQEKQQIIMQLLDSFEIANTSPTIETSFIHWHSCLDFLAKYYSARKGSFSSKLLQIFDGNGIEIDDLIDREILDGIRSGKKHNRTFRFTALRNQYIHDGFDIITDNFSDVVEQGYIMRALAERLLLHLLGISYNQTALGQPTIL